MLAVFSLSFLLFSLVFLSLSILPLVTLLRRIWPPVSGLTSSTVSWKAAKRTCLWGFQPTRDQSCWHNNPPRLGRQPLIDSPLFCSSSAVAHGTNSANFSSCRLLYRHTVLEIITLKAPCYCVRSCLKHMADDVIHLVWLCGAFFEGTHDLSCVKYVRGCLQIAKDLHCYYLCQIETGACLILAGLLTNES